MNYSVIGWLWLADGCNSVGEYIHGHCMGHRLYITWVIHHMGNTLYGSYHILYGSYGIWIIQNIHIAVSYDEEISFYSMKDIRIHLYL